MARGKLATAQMYRRLEEIAKLLTAGLSDKDIMDQLNMPERTYYRYKSRLFKIYQKIAAQKQAQQPGVIEFEAQILKEKLIRLHRALEIDIVDKYKDGKKGRLHDIALASETAAKIAIEIFKAEYKGMKE